MPTGTTAACMIRPTDSVAEHDVVVIVPFAGGTKGRRASEDEVVAPHRATPYAATCGLDKMGQRRLHFTRNGPGLLGGFVIVSSWTRESSRASNIQCSATFSYALFMNGSVACAARCLASSAFRRQSTLSDD